MNSQIKGTDTDPSCECKRGTVVLVNGQVKFSFNHGDPIALTPKELSRCGHLKNEQRIKMEIHRSGCLLDSGVVVIATDRSWLRLEGFEVFFQGHRSLKRADIPACNFKLHDEIHVHVDEFFSKRLGASLLEGTGNVTRGDSASWPFR